jgi:hypothetical protein
VGQRGHLGLIPGAGGTQRLPRLCGVAKALDLCVSGRTIPASEALAAGIIDKIVESNLVDEAIAYAASLGEPRRTGSLPLPSPDPTAVETARKDASRRMRGQTAPLALIMRSRLRRRMVFAEGLERRETAIRSVLHGAQSNALIQCLRAGGIWFPEMRLRPCTNRFRRGDWRGLVGQRHSNVIRLCRHNGAVIDQTGSDVERHGGHPLYYEAGIQKGKLTAADLRHGTP